MCQISVVFLNMCIAAWGIISKVNISYWIVSGTLLFSVFFYFCCQPTETESIEIVDERYQHSTTKVGVDHRFYPISFVQFKYSKLNCSSGQQRATATAARAKNASCNVKPKKMNHSWLWKFENGTETLAFVTVSCYTQWLEHWTLAIVNHSSC